MPSQNRKFGDWGEKIAETFLLKRDYEIIGKNFQKRGGEIDIIAKKENVLHFIEVKTRTSAGIRQFGLPQEAVTVSKQKKIAQTALFYLSDNGYDSNTFWQMDVISIIYSADGNRKAKITFIQNAFGEDHFD